MNIVRISRTFPPIIDGTSIHMYELSKYQEKHHDLHLIVPKRANIPSFLNLHLVDNIDDNKIFYSKLEKLKFHFNALKKYKNLLKKADIVHIVGDLHDVLFIVLLKSFFNYKIILSLHGGTTTKKLYKVLSTIFYRYVDKIYMTSQTVSNQLYYIDETKKYITTSGTKFFEIPKKTYHSQTNYKLISVGRLHEVKAFNELITSMTYINEKYTLTIVGNGPEYQNLNLKIKELGLENRVYLVGEKKREDIYKLLVEHDIFILSSIKLKGQEEGTPTAMMEAMAAGLPIVSTDTGGVRDLMIGYPDECIVPQKDSKSLAKAIEWLGEDLELQKRLSTVSLGIAKTKDWSIVAKNITELFENVLGKR